jgi:hypothetical protein
VDREERSERGGSKGRRPGAPDIVEKEMYEIRQTNSKGNNNRKEESVLGLEIFLNSSPQPPR